MLHCATRAATSGCDSSHARVASSTWRSRRGPSRKRSAAAIRLAGGRSRPSPSRQRSSTSKWTRFGWASCASGTIGWHHSSSRRWSSASRASSALRIMRLRLRRLSAFSAVASTRLPPRSLASWQAASTCDSSSSKLACGGWLPARPMLAVMRRLPPCQATRIASIAPSRRRAAATACSSGSAASTVNSSPPLCEINASAAANSACTRRAACRSISSPAAWLAESLTSLKLSRSM